MEETALLNKFVHNIHLKICVAIALYLIRTKPIHKSAKAQGKEVQQLVLNYWQNAKAKEDKYFKHNLICLQQSKIHNELQNIVPSIHIERTFGLEISDSVVTYYDKLNCSSFMEANDSDSDSDFDLGSVEFMRAVVNLKFAVDSWETLPLGEVHPVTKNVLHNESLMQRTGIQQQSIICSQEDSGFESSKMTNDKIESYIVSSRIFRPVTHSRSTDLLLTKSAESVLKYVRKKILQTPKEAFINWEGSLLQRLFNILKKTLNAGFCSDLIVSFIQDILNNIWKTRKKNKHAVREYQCFILAELCNDKFVCGEILNFLSEKFTELVENLHYKNENTDNVSDLLVKSSYFIQLNLTLLLKWRKFRKKTTRHKTFYDSFKGINWKIDETKHSKENKTIEVHKIWKQCYIKLLSICTTHFPIISYHAWELVQVVDSLDKMRIKNTS